MSRRFLPSISFRTRILLLVFGVAVAPLALTGFWLTGSSVRSGEALLRSRLGEALDEDRRTIAARWIPYRSILLDVAEHPSLAAVLAAGGPEGVGPDALTTLGEAVEGLPPEVVAVRAKTPDGETIWRRERSPRPSPLAFGTPLRIEVDIRDRISGEVRGTLEVSLPFQALLRETSGGTQGVTLVAFDQPEGILVTPTRFDPAVLGRPRFLWDSQDWVTSSLDLREPRIRLVAAAPVAPFVAPFRRAARQGGLLLLLTAGLGMAAAGILTGRMTRSLEALAGAAGAVSRGDLEPTVEEGGGDEIGRVARAFNQMTASLRLTLARLADREALAAVGEFAASLAHEVRNPLTAIQLDLQQVEERLPPGSPEHDLQTKALEHVRRLNRTVTGALQAARSGRGAAGDVDVREPLRRALEAARPAFEEAAAEVVGPSSGARLAVEADADALEQAFLNVLLNAAQAVEPEGTARVGLGTEAGEVVVSVEDDGRGIPPEILERVFEPLVSRRKGGTGLGLPITNRIVQALGGRIAIDSAPGRGTVVRIHLPHRSEEAGNHPDEASGVTNRSGAAPEGVTIRDGALDAASRVETSEVVVPEEDR